MVLYCQAKLSVHQCTLVVILHVKSCKKCRHENVHELMPFFLPNLLFSSHCKQHKWRWYVKTCWVSLCSKMTNFPMEMSDCNWRLQKYATNSKNCFLIPKDDVNFSISLWFAFSEKFCQNFPTWHFWAIINIWIAWFLFFKAIYFIHMLLVH